MAEGTKRTRRNIRNIGNARFEYKGWGIILVVEQYVESSNTWHETVLHFDFCYIWVLARSLFAVAQERKKVLANDANWAIERIDNAFAGRS